MTAYQERGEAAAAAYLERVGLVQVAPFNEQGVGVWLDASAGAVPCLVGVLVRVRRSSAGAAEVGLSRTALGRVRSSICAVRAESGLSGASERVDVVTLLVLAADRALLRHHRAAWVESDGLKCEGLDA